MILRSKRRESSEQPPAEKQNEAGTPSLPPKKRKEKTTPTPTPKKKSSEKVVESTDSPVPEELRVNVLLEQNFPVQNDPVLKKRIPNVEQEESDQEEWSTRRKRKKPEDRRRTGNREKDKSKKTKKGDKIKTSNTGRERDKAIKPPSQLSPREENGSNKGRERDEAVNLPSQLSPREEDGLPISNDGELEIVRLNSGDVVAISNEQATESEFNESNEQETEPEFNESVAEEGCQLLASVTQNFSGSSSGASGSGLGGVMDPGSCTKKKMVHFNDKGQPIGEGSTSFTTELGSIARKHCPISYQKWRDVPDQTKDVIWKLVTDKYIVPVAYKGKVLHKILSSWKRFKGVLRSKHYDKYDTDEERKRNCPNGVRQELWDIFVDNHSTPVAQAQRLAGKIAVQAMKTPQTSGRTGAARTAEALKKGNPFATVTRTDLYLAMHSRKDGSCPTPESTAKVEQIKAIAKQDPSSVNLDVDNDPVGQVLGPEKKGFVRGMGSVSKTELLLSGPVIDKLQEERRLRLSAERQIADLREQLVSQALDPSGYQFEEERRLLVSAEEQIAVLKRQVVSQMEQIDQLKQERTLRLAAEAQITGLKVQITSQGEMITDMKQLIKRLC